MYIGMHATWEVYHGDDEKLSYVPYIKKALHSVTATLDLVELNEAFKQFNPVGVTGFILLEESHISIHTWPEHNYAAVDVFSCKPFDSAIVTNVLKTLFNTDTVVVNIIKRGDLKIAKEVVSKLK